MASKYQVGTSAFKTAFADVIASVGRPTGHEAWLQKAKTRATQLHTDRSFDHERAFDLGILNDKLEEIHTRAAMQMGEVAAEQEIEQAVEEEIAQEVQRESAMPRTAPAPATVPTHPSPAPSTQDRRGERQRTVSVPVRTLGRTPAPQARNLRQFFWGLGIGLSVGILLSRFWK